MFAFQILIDIMKLIKMENYKKFNANPHRGAYSLSLEATEQYENTREKIAKFINARNKEEIIKYAHKKGAIVIVDALNKTYKMFEKYINKE